MNICNAFIKLAESTWEILGQAEKINFRFKEETVTDLLIFLLKNIFTSRIVTYEFNRRQEGVNGADWELWLIDKKNKCICFRMQAKILDFLNDSYNELHYKKTNGIYQADLLKKISAQCGAIPLYLFYSNWDLNKYPIDPKSCCKEDFKTYGCTIAIADKIIQIRNKNTLLDILPLIKPWHCLFCTDTTNSTDPILKIQEKFNELFNAESKTNYILISPPHYIQLLLESKEIKNMPDDEISRITIIRV